MTATGDHVRVTVEFIAPPPGGEGSVSGRVIDDGGAATPFAGWIGLLEELEISAARLAHLASTDT